MADLKTISESLQSDRGRKLCSHRKDWQPVFQSVGGDMEINVNYGQREMLHVLRKKDSWPPRQRWPRHWAALSRVKDFVRSIIQEEYVPNDREVFLASGSLLADRAIVKGQDRLSQDLHTDVDYRWGRQVYSVIIPLDSQGVELWVSLTA